MFKKCRKGFTLIEVIISMAIMAMVMVTVYSMFFSNYKTMNTVNSGVELQSQGEQATNYLESAALSATKVNYIIDEFGNKFEQLGKADNMANNIKISEISFTTVKYDKTTGNVTNDYEIVFSLEENAEYQLLLGEKSYNLKVKESPSAIDGARVAQFVSSLEVKPLFEGRYFSEISDTEIGVENITGIEFTITLKISKGKDLMTKTINNKVNFRNWH